MVSEARAPRSIFEWIELPLAGHRHRERPQSMKHLYAAGMLRDHVRKTPIGHRAFVQVGAHQCHATPLEPGIHLSAGKAALRLLAAKQPSSAVHRRIERSPRFRAVDPFEDYGIIAHRAPDEAALSRECRGGAFAHHPEIAAAMLLPPCVIVVVVDHVSDGTTDDFADPLNHPFAAGVGIASSQLHGGDVTAPELAILVDHRRRNVHAVLPAGGLEIAGRAGMTEAAAAEVDADPDVPGLVAHEVDVVVSGSDGAELRHRLLPVLAHVRLTPSVAVVEQFMLDALVVRPADAKGNDLLHVPDDLPYPTLDRAEGGIEPHGHVAAADIEADT